MGKANSGQSIATVSRMDKEEKARFQIVYQPSGKSGTYKGPIRLLDAARRAGVGLESVCGGIGDCGRCKVIVTKGPTSHLTGIEETLLTEEELKQGYRLACCTRVYGEAEVFLPPSVRLERQRLQLEAVEMPLEVEPVVREYLIDLPAATLVDIRPDFRRLREALKATHSVEPELIDYSALKAVSPMIREEEWSVRVALRGNEIISVVPADEQRASLGLAVDLGTTKIALYLVDLSTGQTIDKLGIQNPQIPYGEDVISRLQTIMEDEEALELQSAAVTKAINKQIVKMCKRNRTIPQRILEATIVGNTAMHHILLRLSTRQLALSPFVPATDRPVEVKARELGLNICPGAFIYFLPPVAGFVGSDHVAMLLASGFYQHEGNVLGLDIGTNTEIALKTQEGITSCSTASGPAFEGARIKCGMRAAPGAVERVKINDGDLKVEIKTIADGAPIGICGSGIVDAIAQMLRVGIIDDRGKLQLGRQGVRQNSAGKREFVLAQADDHRCANDIVVTQRDVAEIQLAKGAIRTGMNILMARAGLAPENIDRVVIAGAFGSYMDPASAIALGMFPRIPLERFTQVGNAAGAGAKAILVSMEQRRRAEQLAREVGYIELAVEPDFHQQFARGMKFNQDD